MNEQKERGINNAVDVMKRQYGKISIKKNYLIETIVQMLHGVIKDYPVIVVPLLDFPLRAAFIRAGSNLVFLTKNDENLHTKFIRGLPGRYTNRLNSRILAEESVSLLKDAKKMIFTIGFRK